MLYTTWNVIMLIFFLVGVFLKGFGFMSRKLHMAELVGGVVVAIFILLMTLSVYRFTSVPFRVMLFAVASLNLYFHICKLAESIISYIRGKFFSRDDTARNTQANIRGERIEKD